MPQTAANDCLDSSCGLSLFLSFTERYSTPVCVLRKQVVQCTNDIHLEHCLKYNITMHVIQI